MRAKAWECFISIGRNIIKVISLDSVTIQLAEYLKPFKENYHSSLMTFQQGNSFCTFNNKKSESAFKESNLIQQKLEDKKPKYGDDKGMDGVFGD